MRWIISTVVLAVVGANGALAAHHFATITGVDADKGTVTYKLTGGKNNGTEVKAPVAKDCVIKEGYYRLGKPSVTKEGDDIPKGLKNDLFQKATAEKPLAVDVYTADKDDADTGVKRGDIVKILVNPPPPKKPE